jgi:hypothetical protein
LYLTACKCDLPGRFEHSKRVPVAGKLPIRHGKKEILCLTWRFRIAEQKAVNGMRVLVYSLGEKRDNSRPDGMRALNVCVQTIPRSSAETERGFSAMNLIVSYIRASLRV